MESQVGFCSSQAFPELCNKMLFTSSMRRQACANDFSLAAIENISY